jgi:hypothetical protein
MPIDDDLLQSFVLQTRLMIYESLLLKLHILMAKMMKQSLSIDACLQATQEVLEEAAVDTDAIYLRDDHFAALTSEERSLLADETRDVLESMKQHASLIASKMKLKEQR